MAKRGRKVIFHGAFRAKAKAKRKEQRLKHAYVRQTRIQGHTRYLVLTRRKRGR